MTNEELQAQLKTVTEQLAAVVPVIEKVKTLESTLAEKDKVITDLQSKQNQSSQEQALLGLKTKYPDVPESLLKALPEASREAEAKALQEKFGQLKTAPGAVKTGPNAWDNAGIGPSLEAEDQAALALREKARNESVAKGDVMGVLRAKSRDTLEFLARNYGR